MEEKTKILQGLRFSDSHLTQLANHITEGLVDGKPTGQLDVIQTTVEDAIRDAKIANSRYQHITGKKQTPHYSHLLQIGNEIIQEINNLKDNYLEGLLGEQ